MIQCQVKLRLNSRQQKTLESWLPILAGVWNFGVRKIELNARNRIYFSAFEFQNLLAGHGKKVGVPSHVLRGVLAEVHIAWDRCFRKLARKPRLKGFRRRMCSIPFQDPIKLQGPHTLVLLGVGRVRFHKQDLPEGRIKCARAVLRPSGWHLCLFIDAAPNAIQRTDTGIVGIDPGFHDLITLSTGERIEHPKEFQTAAKRLGQAQRGNRHRLRARIQERIASRRKDRNHKLSRRLVSEKSVGDSAHGGLRQQLQYKSLIGGTELIFPDNRNSTRTCSTCGALTGPSGLAGLKVREWKCGACGAHHERDVNAARNALISGAGCAHEKAYAQGVASGIRGSTLGASSGKG